jgi:hypothetical protein
MVITVLRKTKLMISGVAVVALAGAGIGVAEAADTPAPAPPPSPSPSPSAPAHPGRHHGMRARVAHGQFTLNGKQHRTVDIQRGTVQAVSPTSVTVRSSDGFTASYATNANTKVRKNKQQSNAGQLAVNDQVTVLADVNGSTATATHISDGGTTPPAH